MATKFQKDQQVKLKGVVPQGPVLKLKMDEDTGAMSYLIEWVDADGEAKQRWFAEDELTEA